MAISDPGFTSEKQSVERQVTFAGLHRELLQIQRGFTIDSLAADAGNTPTTELRAGLVMAIQTADGNAYPYVATAKDGTQNPIGFLPDSHDTLSDIDKTATDANALIITRGNVQESETFGLDEHAKSVLQTLGFIFDEQPTTVALGIPTTTEDVTTNHTVVAGDNGRMFIIDGASGATNFTLPTIAFGLKFTFFQTDNQNMVVTGSSNIVARNVDAGSTITYSTASQLIGSHCSVQARYHGTTLKWFFTDLGGTTFVAA